MHDEYIKNRTEALIHPKCDGEFEALQQLFCLACNEDEYKYINSTDKMIYLCQDFAESIWGDKYNLDAPSKKYDICGIRKDEIMVNVTKNEVIVPSRVILIY